MLRTHTCGELRIEHSGTKVTLAGWIHRCRDHGPVLFIDLRDRYGITQLVADPATYREARTALDEARSEYVLQVTGRVQPRPPGWATPRLGTGAIEVEVHSAKVLSRSKLPPLRSSAVMVVRTSRSGSNIATSISDGNACSRFWRSAIGR